VYLPGAPGGRHKVTTIEGLERNGQLDPLQQEFIHHGAVQCGFCTPGLIMTSRALLNDNADPREDDIRHALKDTFCRCTGYASVNPRYPFRRRLSSAVKGLSRRLCPIPTMATLKVVGHSVPSQEAVAKVTGRALYTDDYSFPDMLYARTAAGGLSARAASSDPHGQGESRTWRPRRADVQRRAGPQPHGLVYWIGRYCATIKCAIWAIRLPSSRRIRRKSRGGAGPDRPCIRAAARRGRIRRRRARRTRR